MSKEETRAEQLERLAREMAESNRKAEEEARKNEEPRPSKALFS